MPPTGAGIFEERPRPNRPYRPGRRRPDASHFAQHSARHGAGLGAPRRRRFLRTRPLPRDRDQAGLVVTGCPDRTQKGREMIRSAYERGPDRGTRTPRRLFLRSRYPALSRRASRWLEQLAPALFRPDWVDAERWAMTPEAEASEKGGAA